MPWPEDEYESTAAEAPEAAAAPEPQAASPEPEPSQREIEAPYADGFISPSDPLETTERTIPLRVYLSNPTPAEIDATSSAIRSLCSSLDLEIYIDLDGESGSWFKRWIARTVDALTHDEVLKRLAKAERALELHGLDKHQAQADQPRLEGAAELLTAIGDNDAVVQVGSVLLIRQHNEHGPARIVVRTLTQSELAFLERNQEFLHSPADLIRVLQNIDKDAGSVGARPKTP